MQRLAILVALFMLFQASNAQSNENPIRKTYPYSIVEVLVDKPKDENVKMAKPLPLDKIPFKQRTDKYISIGTAWFSSPKMLFSAAHVFAPASAKYTSNYYVRTMEGEVFEIDSVSIYSSKYDVMAFTLKSYPKKIVPIQINKSFAIGDDVCVPGNALGEGISIRCGGQISSLNPEPANGEWKEVYFSTPVSPGNSGGPLLDSKGKAIGIVVRKINGEDLNIAMPFSEMKKVKSKLEMFVKDEGYRDSEIPDLRATADIRVVSNQTMPVMAWMNLVIEEINQHYQKMNKTFVSLWMKKGLLANKNAKSYFMNPSKGPYFTQIKMNSAQNGMEGDTGKIAEIQGEKRRLILQSIGNSIFFFVESMKDEKAGDLLGRPVEIMDSILSSGSFLKRRIADEEIKYLSLGEPYDTAPVSDLLGRNWTLYRWSVKEIQANLNLLCTARPSGVACVMEERGSFMSTETIAADFPTNAAELALGYYGTSKQWQEFSQLSPSVKPKFMADLKISVSDKNLIVADDDINFTIPIGTREKDDLVLSYSYGVNTPLNPVLFAASYYPRSNESTILTTSMIYRGKTQEDKDAFAKVFKGEKPFDGGVYERQQGQLFSAEVVSKVSNSCLVLGTFVSDDEKKLQKFKKSVLFDEEDEALSH